MLSSAGALRAHGGKAHDRVTVLDYNNRWLLAAHFGVPGARGVLVALNTRLAAPEYVEILSHSHAKLLLVTPALAHALGVRRADELPVDTVVMLPGEGPLLKHRSSNEAGFRRDAGSWWLRVLLPVLSPDDSRGRMAGAGRRLSR
jgi:acyl-CoA synthetase (AMP-forming)/AMP-acid ligase II